MASGRIKGITIEIEGKTDKLNNALKGIDGQLNKTQRSLKDVDKLLKAEAEAEAAGGLYQADEDKTRPAERSSEPCR